jgi:hypothetical protein
MTSRFLSLRSSQLSTYDFAFASHCYRVLLRVCWSSALVNVRSHAPPRPPPSAAQTIYCRHHITAAVHRIELGKISLKSPMKAKSKTVSSTNYLLHFLLCILGETGFTMRLMTSCSQLRGSHQECITITKPNFTSICAFPSVSLENGHYCD